VRTVVTRALGGVLLVATLVSGLAACTDEGGSSTPSPEPTPEPTSSAPERVDLQFGAFGTNDEIAAYTTMAKAFGTINDRADVTVAAWQKHDGLRRAIEQGKPVPDVFLVSRRDLRWFVESGLTRPVDTLLDERGVDFGDVYSRDALEAFSSDNRLQCMPYGVSPQVVFYNESMVDFDRMELRGLDVPADHRRWNWDQFVAAAKFAARPARGTKGVSIDPTLLGLAPFVYSGGGDLFDDSSDPTSLAFGGEGTQDALETTLPLFRDPKLTLTEEQLAEKSPLEWFEEGKVGMITGSRALVPVLREVPGLRFDVMPIPSIEGAATVGDITGLCISKDAESPATSADFMVYASSTEAVSEVVREGYLQPANQEVAFSDDFLQPDEMPVDGAVFNEAVTRMVIPPLLDTWDVLEDAVGPYLQQLFYSVPTVDLPLLGDQIDVVSQPILNPDSSTPTPETATPETATPDPTQGSSED
jgi:multiple sugar transport system substrate-binding protein